MNTLCRLAIAIVLIAGSLLAHAEPRITKHTLDGTLLESVLIPLESADIVAHVNTDNAGNIWAARAHFGSGSDECLPDNALLKYDQNLVVQLTMRGDMTPVTGTGFDSEGNIYAGSRGVASCIPQERWRRIRKYDSAGNFLFDFPDATGNSNSEGREIEVTTDNRIFSLSNGGRYFEFDTSGNVVRVSDDIAQNFTKFVLSSDEQALFTKVRSGSVQLGYKNEYLVFDTDFNLVNTFEPGFCHEASPCDPSRQIVNFVGQFINSHFDTLSTGELLEVDKEGTAFILSQFNGDLITSFPLEGVAAPRSEQGEAIRDFMVDANDNIWVASNPPIRVVIDVKKHDRINLRSKKPITVAVLSTDSFDALQINTVPGPLADPDDPMPVYLTGSGSGFYGREIHGRVHVKDVNKDGMADMLLHFNAQESGIQCGDTEVTLAAYTYRPYPIIGKATIRTVKCHK